MIESIEDLQKYVQIVSATPWENMEPEVNTAKEFALEFVEPQLITALNTQLAGTPSVEWLKLDDLYSRFLANWGIYTFIPKAYISVSGAGVRVTHTENAERAPKWIYEETRKAYFESAYKSLETMLAYIHANCMTSGQAFFSSVSDPYKAKFTGMFKDSIDFNGASVVKTNFYTFQRIAHSFTECIELYLRPSFAVYLDTFIPKVNKNVAEGSLFLYMRKIVAAMALKKNINALVLGYDNAGLRALPLQSDETLQGVAMTPEDKNGLRHECDTNVNHYQALIKEFIKINHANLPGIASTPIYATATSENYGKRHDYKNSESRGTFFM